jgi:hypothetical protein
MNDVIDTNTGARIGISRNGWYHEDCAHRGRQMASWKPTYDPAEIWVGVSACSGCGRRFNPVARPNTSAFTEHFL